LGGAIRVQTLVRYKPVNLAGEVLAMKKVAVFVKVVGRIDGEQLFELVEQFGMSVTDLLEETLVYGECTPEEAGQVVYYSALFGDIMAEITNQK
jgi:hypothetical protein